MSIKIRREKERYIAEVTPSPKLPVIWETENPMNAKELIDRLLELGYHLQDIVDAFTFADPDWMTRNGFE